MKAIFEDKRKDIHALFKSLFEKFGFVMIEDYRKVLIYHPDSLFFVRFEVDCAKYGMVLKDYILIENIPEDLWQWKGISFATSSQGYDKEELFVAVREVVSEFEDYVYGIDLISRVKKHFKPILRDNSFICQSIIESFAHSEVSIENSELSFEVYRSYWQNELSITCKNKKSGLRNNLAILAKEIGLTIPNKSMVQTKHQIDYLNKASNVVQKLIE